MLRGGSWINNGRHCRSAYRMTTPLIATSSATTTVSVWPEAQNAVGMGVKDQTLIVSGCSRPAKSKAAGCASNLSGCRVNARRRPSYNLQICRPFTLMTRIHKLFPDVFPEAWASDWGEDDYGIFMGFTYKGVRQDFRWIEPGTFQMGSPLDEPERRDNETLHEVTLTQGYWLADTTVTQALWEAVMGENPSRSTGAHLPVEAITWHDAQAFIDKMNGLKAALRLCLPTEAQWEYACRAGTTAPFFFGGQITSEQVNFNGTEPYNKARKSEYRAQTVEVGSLPPNDWGLYEMHGNVWKWCQDWYGDYPAQPVVDPQWAVSGARHVLRGGSWFDNGRSCRSAYRGRGDPAGRDIFGDLDGFRLARGLELQVRSSQ